MLFTALKSPGASNENEAYLIEIFVFSLLYYYHEYFIVCFCRLSVNLLIGISEIVVIRKSSVFIYPRLS